MALYTVILEFRDGTYTSQVAAESPRDALMSWASDLDPTQIRHLGTSGKDRVLARLRNDPTDAPVAVSGLKNVWCHSGLLSGMLVNIIRTDSAP